MIPNRFFSTLGGIRGTDVSPSLSGQLVTVDQGYPSVSLANTDPYFANVATLLHMEGTEGGTTFIDSGPLQPTFSTSSARTSNTRPKFGTGNAYVSTGGGYIIFNSSTAFATNSPFTLEFWFQVTSSQASIRNLASTGTGQYVALTALSLSTVGYGTSATIGVSLNTWYHVAVSSNGSTDSKVFVNGVLLGSGAMTGSSPNQFAVFARTNVAPTSFSNGVIDEVRFTTGVQRYTSNFIPPTQQFPDA